MGLIIIGAGVVVVAVAAALFLPQTASLFPEPGQIVDSVRDEVSGMGQQAQGAAGGVVGDAAAAAGGVVGDAAAAAGGAVPAAGAAAGATAGSGGSAAGASPAPGDAALPPPHKPPRADGSAGPASATARAAAAESSVGSLVSLSRAGAGGGADMPAMCIPK